MFICFIIGITSEVITKPDSITQSELLDLIDGLNCNNDVHGLLVQLPVPDHIGRDKFFVCFVRGNVYMY